MPKNKIGGSGHKRAKRVDRNRVGVFNKETDFYARVVEKLGTNQLRVKFHDGREVQVSIPGRMYKKVWIKKEDILCCSEDEVKWKVVSGTEINEAEKMIDAFSTIKEEDNFGGGDDSDEGELDIEAI